MGVDSRRLINPYSKKEILMNILKFTKFSLVGLVTVMLSGLAVADTNTGLQERLANAEARIAEMQASNSNNWLSDQRSEEIRDLVHDVLADADIRASMVGNGSPVTVNVHGFTQFRWAYNRSATDGVDNTHGFSLPRTRLIFSGDVYDWDYKVSGQWSDSNNTFNLLDAYTEHNGFRFGQFKSPFLKEAIVSQTDTLAVDRSLIANQFGQGRSQGVQYGYDFNGNLRFTGAYTDGFSTANGAGVANGYAVTGRVDYSGAWFDVGFAASHNSLDTTDFNTWTVDASTTWNSLEFGGAYVKQTGDATGSNWGATVYAKYDVRDNLDIFVQYEKGVLEGVATDLSIATVGFNYMVNPNMKWTTDLGYSYNGIDGAWNLGQSGWDATASDGEYLIRSQFTVSF